MRPESRFLNTYPNMDPLSIASVSAGFLSLSLQLAGGLIKLRAAQRTYRDAPETVSALIISLQTLCDILTWAEACTDLDALASPIGSHTMRQCMLQTQLLQQSLQDKLEGLEGRFNRHRLGKVSMIWRSEEIDRMLTRVESCKLSFLLALQIITATRTLEGQDQLSTRIALLSRDILGTKDIGDTPAVQDVTKTIDQDQTIQQHTSNACHHVYTCGNSDMIRFTKTVSSTRTKVSFSVIPFGFVVEQTKSTAETSGGLDGVTIHTAGDAVIIDVWLPSWFISSRYRLAIKRATTGWTYQVCLYREVDLPTPLMRACKSGNASLVRQLLSSGSARPYDRLTGTGQTAADMALEACRFETYRVLRSQGLTHQLGTASWLTYILLDAICLKSSLHPSSSHVGFASFHAKSRFICAEANIDVTEITEEEVLQAKALKSTAPFTLRSEVCRALGAHDMEQIPRLYNDWSPKEAFRAVFLLLTAGIWTAEQYDAAQLWLTRYGPVHEDDYLLQTARFDGPTNTLHLCAEMLAYGIANNKNTSFWVQLLHNTIDAGADISLGNSWSLGPSTPLAVFVASLCKARCSMRSVVQQVNDGLQSWLSILARRNIDLLRYGEVETEGCMKCSGYGLRDGAVFTRPHLQGLGISELENVRGIWYGRTVNDWQIEYDVHFNDGTILAPRTVLGAIVDLENQDGIPANHNNSADRSAFPIPGAFE